MTLETPARIAAAKGGRYVCWMSASVRLKECERRYCPSLPYESRW